MRKNNIFLTSLLLCCLAFVDFIDAAAQPVESFRASTNITPQVESFQIAKSGDLTPSLYTGSMTYSLPLYTYSDPDFNIPVSLDYNYDGYKVARSSGTVGLGWALNCGGVITREIRGLKDEYVKEHYNGDAYTQYGYYWVYKNHVGLNNQFSTNRPRTPYLETISTPAELVRHLNDDLYEDVPISTFGDSYELTPDLFHFSFGPYSGDFMMNNDGTLTLTSPTHPQGEFEVIVETTTGLGGISLKFTIKTGDGYEYIFGDSINAREYNTSAVIKDECPDETSTAGGISGWTDTAWKLTTIKAPNGRTVVFSYKDRPVLTPTVTYSYSTYTQLIPTSESMPTPTDSIPSWERTNLNYAYSHPIEHIRIYGVNESITETGIAFSWANKISAEDETAATNYENGMLVASYLNVAPQHPHNVKITSITVRNVDNEIVRSLHFDQASIGFSSGPRRMVLTSVFDSKNGRWIFDYDGGSGSLPEFDSRRHDIWGFWSQAYFDPRRQVFWKDMIRDTPDFSERLDFLKSGSLIKMTYPTGGWSEITYEKNKAEYALNRNLHNLPRLEYFYKECGGIRVKSIFSRSFDSENGLRRSYEYNGGEVLSLRWTRFETNYWKRWGSKDRTYLKGIFYSNDGLSSGSYDNMIGYRQVKESFPDGSYNIHRFNGYYEYPDRFLMTSPNWLDAATAPGTTDVSATDGGISLIPLLISPEQIYSDFRGKVKSVEEYDGAGHLRKRTDYGYTTLAGMSEYRFFNMMTGWMSFFQNRFYPKLSDINETRFEVANGTNSDMSFRTHYTYDRQTGQILGEGSGTPDKSNYIEYVYCSSNPTAKDACNLKAAVSDVIASVWQNDSTLYTGRFHFGYQPNMKGIHPVSLTEYVLDIPSPSSPSETNSRIETTNVTYNKLLRPTNVNMEGDAYIKYDWDSFGRYIISKTVNSDEGKTEYEWKDLVGLTYVKDPTGRVTRYEYNDKGRLSGVRDSDSSLVASYDTYLKSDDGSIQNRTTAYRHLSEDGSVKVGDSKFYNGLGYLYQTISECASGDGANLILPVEYDSMFRPDLKSYLPYPGKSGIRYADNNASTNQSQWYFNNYSTLRAFVERTFETGMSGRPLTEQKAGGVYQTTGKRVRFSYSLNEPCDSVFTFIYNYPSTSSDQPSITCSGRKAARTLAIITAINEDSDTTQTFTDAAGRLILKRQLNDGKRHDTYHIYDLKDSLVCVLQPTGSDGLSVGKVMPYNGTFIQDSCFTWQYDGKGQLTSSHVPGAGTKSYLYDLRGRVVYKDDSNIVRASGNGWYFVYDNLDRVTESGIGIKAYNNSNILNGLAEGFDIKTFLYQTKVLKEYDYYSKNDTSKYNLASFEPVDGIVSAVDVSDTRCATMLSSEKVFDAPYYYASDVYPGGTTILRLGNTDGYIRRTYWYDRKGRIIQKLETTSDNWTSRYSTRYDFTGNVVATMEKHISPSGRADSILIVNNYDRRGRLASYTRTLNANPLDSVFYSYDFAGRIQSKRTRSASSTSPSDLTESYSRDVRGWMTGITVNDLKLGQVFTESLEYMSPTLTAIPLFSGNISEVKMTGYGQSVVHNTYNYDHIGRLLGNKRYVDGSPTPVGTETGLRYDLNGNIKELTRNDGNSHYAMRMSHTGNRIKECAIEPDDQSGVSQTYSCSYDFNGNMTNICRSNDIWYNILDLPHHSAGNTYNYYSDGTKAEVCDSSDMRLIYRGNFTYRKVQIQGGGDFLWLDSVRYPDGQIFCGPQVPTNSDADCWYIKDHLGNIRAVYCLNSEGSMPVIEVNDYLPFGGRIRNNASPQFSANRFRYAGKEEYDDFAVTESLTNAGITANDFGARYLISFLGSWTSPDPKSVKYFHSSPFAYCANNPILLFDNEGADIVIGGKNDSSVTIRTDKLDIAFSLESIIDWGGNYTIDGASQILTAALDIAGCFDQTGTADILNAGIQFSDGQYLDGIISVASAIPFVGDAAKLTRIGKDIDAINGIVKAVDKGSTSKTKMLKFTRRNFRKNLILKTGVNPIGMEAHHSLPVKHYQEFSRIGIDIHNPTYGQWIEKNAHRQKALEYTKRWDRFFETTPNATKEQVLSFKEIVSREVYGY